MVITQQISKCLHLAVKVETRVRWYNVARCMSSTVRLKGVEYGRDEWTNVNENIMEKVERKLLSQKYHPLNHLLNMIKFYFYKNYTLSGSPLFSVFDSFSPVVSVDQNFDRFELPSYHERCERVNHTNNDSNCFEACSFPRTT